MPPMTGSLAAARIELSAEETRRLAREWGLTDAEYDRILVAVIVAGHEDQPRFRCSIFKKAIELHLLVRSQHLTK